MKRIVFSLISLFLLNVPFGLAEESQKHSVIPKDGFVRDENTAIQIAIAVLVPIYGEQQIESEQPFKAVLKNEVWSVSGSLTKYKCENCIVKGGVAMIEISKQDGRILWVSHGR